MLHFNTVFCWFAFKEVVGLYCWLCILDELDTIRHQLNQDRDKLLISSFCPPRLYSREVAMSDVKYNPSVTWFNLSLGVRNMLVPLCDRKDSAVFQHIWKVELKRVAAAGNKLTLDQIEQSVWQQSNSIWEDFCRGMVGTVTECCMFRMRPCDFCCVTVCIALLYAVHPSVTYVYCIKSGNCMMLKSIL